MARINTNVASLMAQQGLARSQTALAGTLQRLSSGLRINTGADDPAGLIASEGLRAFKRTTILGYEIPWNNFDFSYQAYLALEKHHIERKVAALERYASQQHRRYANGEYVWSVARTHGVNVNREYAEVFQVYRVIS